MIDSRTRQDLIAKFGRGPKDSGSPEVQIALLTARINDLAPHFAKHPHDFCSNRGLMKLIGQRKSLLKYLQRTAFDRYTKVLKDLDLRK
ncbi:MAG: 30S ribosomal protein S15 [Bacteriovoracaceae bacterium]|nr:30S ribosomal protein S15 [Bacteriovoracaceae bacterium]